MQTGLPIQRSLSSDVTLGQGKGTGRRPFPDLPKTNHCDELVVTVAVKDT